MAWTGALALSSLLVMLTMPALGAYADLRAAKKRLLLFSTAGCVVTTIALRGSVRATWLGPSWRWCCPTCSTATVNR